MPGAEGMGGGGGRKTPAKTLILSIFKNMLQHMKSAYIYIQYLTIFA